LINIRPVGAELLLADLQTDRYEKPSRRPSQFWRSTQQNDTPNRII